MSETKYKIQARRLDELTGANQPTRKAGHTTREDYINAMSRDPELYNLLMNQRPQNS